MSRMARGGRSYVQNLTLLALSVPRPKLPSSCRAWDVVRIEMNNTPDAYTRSDDWDACMKHMGVTKGLAAILQNLTLLALSVPRPKLPSSCRAWDVVRIEMNNTHRIRIHTRSDDWDACMKHMGRYQGPFSAAINSHPGI